MNILIKYMMIANFIMFFNNCSPQKSSLPLQIPDNLTIRFNENGGMSPYSLSVVLSADSCSYRLITSQREEVIINYTIDYEEFKRLYQLFRELSFDKLKNVKPKHITYDAGGEGINLSYKGNSISVSSGSNSPFTNKKHLRNYLKLKAEIFDLFSIAAVSDKKDF